MTKPKSLRTLDLDFFETVLLFNVLTNQDYLSSVVSHLDISLFNDKNIAKVIEKITNFFVERGTLPSITELKARLATDEEQKALVAVKDKLSQIDATFNYEELIQNTEKFLKERLIYKTILDVADKFSTQAFKLEETLLEFEKAYNINLTENLGHWYFEDIDKHVKDLTTVHNPIPTGWKFLDDKIEGGLFPKTLTVFAGQVNVGKSIVLGNLATNMLMADKNVLLISLEMSEFMYSKRISTQLTQIPHNDLKLFPNELIEQVNHIKNKIASKLIVKDYPPKTITVRHIDSYITKLIHKGFKPDLIVIDYINLIHPIQKNLNSYESVKEIAEHLRALAFKYNLPIVSATQLNRGSFNTSSPGMEGIAESIGLAATCDIICSLWQEPEDRELGIINMGMQKNRFGPNFGHGAFKCNYNTLTLNETNPDYFAADNQDENVVRDLDQALSSTSTDKKDE